MSLDIYLEEEEWCGPVNEPPQKRKVTVHEQNITHNLGEMAKEAGFYLALWHLSPKHIMNPFRVAEGINNAAELGEAIRSGLEKMKADPEHFKKFDAPKSWGGTYDQFIPWLEELLEACERYPEAKVRVSR